MNVVGAEPLYFSMKKDNTRPALQFQIFNPDGTGRDLSGSVVMFYMKKGATLKVNAGVCVAVNAAEGVMEYQWEVGDTDEAGTYRGEVRIDGVETYPTDGYMTIEIFDDLP